MLWSTVNELSLCIVLILIILYGLFSLSMSSSSLGFTNSSSLKVYGNSVSMEHSAYLKGMRYASQPAVLYSTAGLVNLYLSDVYFFSRLWPVMLLLGYAIDFPLNFTSQSLVTTASSVNVVDSALVDNMALNVVARLNDSWAHISAATVAYPYNNGIDILLIFLMVVIMQSFRSFESVLLLLLAFVGQLFMLHSCDLVSFYICLEAQNLCFLVLCGLQPRLCLFFRCTYYY